MSLTITLCQFTNSLEHCYIIRLVNKDTLVNVMGDGSKVVHGNSSYEEMVKSKCILVDKSMLIKDIVDGMQAYLILRPRRFGKSMNLSMLKAFLDINSDSSSLFKDTLISKETSFCKDHRNKYPVIHICFSFCASAKNFSGFLRIMGLLFAGLYKEMSYLKSSLIGKDLERFSSIESEEADELEISFALMHLVTYLHNYHNKKVYILADEYDAALASAYKHNFLAEASDHFAGMLSSGSKDHNSNPKLVLCGITNMSLGTLGSPLNHLTVSSFSSGGLSQYFGFTKEEVEELVQKTSTTLKIEDILKYYNGYKSGVVELLNPWSVLKCIDEKKIECFWPATAAENVIRNIILWQGPSVHGLMSALSAGETLKVNLPSVNSNYAPENVENQIEFFWMFMISTGYVTIKGNHNALTKFTEIIMPNEEICIHVQDLILSKGFPDLSRFVPHLYNDDLGGFYKELHGYLNHSTSFKHINQKCIEKDYHAFFNGVFFHVSRDYIIHSETEAGKGLCDLFLISKRKELNSYGFELKVALTIGNLQKRAEAAVQQIIDKEYYKIGEKYDIKKLWIIGLSFCGKDMAMMHSDAAVDPQNYVTSVKCTYLFEDITTSDLTIEKK